MDTVFKRIIGLAAMSMVYGCAPVGALTREYYQTPETPLPVMHATITGSVEKASEATSRITVYIGLIDGKPVSLPKRARCNFDRHYAVVPGTHVLKIGYFVGVDYASSLVGFGDVTLEAAEGKKYVVKGGRQSTTTGTLWIVEESTGTEIAGRVEVQLKDSPAKRMPIGFAAMESSCSIP